MYINVTLTIYDYATNQSNPDFIMRTYYNFMFIIVSQLTFEKIIRLLYLNNEKTFKKKFLGHYDKDFL